PSRFYCLSAYSCYVVDFWRGEDETGDGITGWIVEVVFLTVTGSRNRTAYYWNIQSQGAVVDVFFIAMRLAKSRGVPASVMVSWKNLNIIVLGLELGAPDITGH